MNTEQAKNVWIRRRCVMNMTAEKMIIAVYGKSRNLITPYSVRIGKVSNQIAYEISQGKGFDNNTVYGVSFVRADALGWVKPMFELNTLVDSLQEAWELIEKVKTEVRTNA